MGAGCGAPLSRAGFPGIRWCFRSTPPSAACFVSRTRARSAGCSP